jgi:hypothetical protein
MADKVLTYTEQFGKVVAIVVKNGNVVVQEIDMESNK